MIRKLNFEEIANNFSQQLNSGNPNMSTVSRCDYIIINNKEILFIEETNLEVKNLMNPNVYAEEVIENIKKMWGSMAVFMWYVSKNELIDEVRGKNRIYILIFEKVSWKTVRILSNMIKTLIKYRDGGFADVKFKIKGGNNNDHQENQNTKF